MGSYVPVTKEEQITMLKTIGIPSIEHLFHSIPEEIQKSSFCLPPGKSEMEAYEYMNQIADKNKVFSTIFRGAGAYDHYIPSIVKSIPARENFLTAYAPYQAEISQGILQSIFEYQTMICELTGMEVSNASIYDGAVAAAEAIAMCRDRKRNKAYVSATVNPFVLSTIKTYCFGSDTELIIVPECNGLTDIEVLKTLLDQESSCVYIQQPNYYGNIESADTISELAHSKGAKLIMGVNPISCALLKTPGEYGADIAVGEGQPLGLPLSFGGPYIGFMATTKEMMRKLPGRIVGETTDIDGKRAFVLTLQAREQHIRREKAASNICTNQALCALTVSIYLASMGPDGMKQVAEQCYRKAHYAAEQISSIPGFSMIYDHEFFHEFVTASPCAPEVLMGKLEEQNILGGLPVEHGILWCVTEKNTKEQMDRLVELLKEVSLT